MLVRQQPHYRREAFESGLVRAGFAIGTASAKRGNVLLIWNRYGGAAAMAAKFERAGGTVLVAENGFIGADDSGRQLYQLAIGHQSGWGTWTVGPSARWPMLGITPAPFRTDGDQVVVLAQRGIGEPPVRSTHADAIRMAAEITRAIAREPTLRGLRVRVRHHPGNGVARLALEDELRDARCVVTHSSSAGIRALVAGVPCVTTGAGWVGAAASRLVNNGDWAQALRNLNTDDAARAAMLERMAWAQWTVDEIATGVPFEYLCTLPRTHIAEL